MKPENKFDLGRWTNDPFLQGRWQKLLQIGLDTDGVAWDWTALTSLQNIDAPVRAKIIAKEAGVWAGSSLCLALNQMADQIGAKVQVEPKVRDGQQVSRSVEVCSIQGGARAVLAVERTLLNLCSYVSGIATLTHQFTTMVSAAGLSKPPRVTCTRKIMPGYQDLVIYGVIAGGGHPHRPGLSSGVLIKENHIRIAGGIENAVIGARKLSPHLMKIEVEVRDQKELQEALRVKTDVVMLDNFSPEQVALAIETVQSSSYRAIVEVSGGINVENIKEYLIDGVDVISIGALSHSVRSLDLSLLIT